jgi:hypothetical protein
MDRSRSFFNKYGGWIFGGCGCLIVIAGLFFFGTLGVLYGPSLWTTYVSGREAAKAATSVVDENLESDSAMTQAEQEALWDEKLAELAEQAGANPETPAEPAGEPAEAAWPIENSSQQFQMPPVKSTWSQGGWEVIEYDLDDDPIVKGWLQRLQDPNPSVWRTFPNIPNPDVPEFNVAAGAEYGVANVPYCQQDMRCDLVVPPWHYRLVTGNYQFLDRTCGAEGVGCLLLVINVMDKTYTWRDVIIDNGFTVPGRYWDGDKLEWATWGLVSHASANMLNMPTMASEDKVLNAGDPGNAGGNCGDVNGCQTIDATVVVHAGDRILAVAHTTVTR